MASSAGSDLAGIAVLNGGPLDGREHPIESDTDELCVVMVDGQQNRYIRTDDIQALPSGQSALVFDCTGRYYGPR